MKFDQTTAMDVLKTPSQQQEIQKVKNIESQLRVFTEEMSKHELSTEPYWNELLATMKARSDKKFNRVLQFARYPLPVVELSKSILKDFFKVFDGKNRFFNVEGDRNIDRLHEWIRENNPDQWIQEQALDVFKNKPMSFVVVDVDQNGIPFLILVDSNRLHDARFKNSQGDLEYIAFIHSQKVEGDIITTFYSVYDEESYFVYSKRSDSDDFAFVSEAKHNIGHCPAKAFIKTPSNSKNPFARNVTFSSALSKMEDWSIFDIFRNYVDHYAPFPVTEAPKKKCGNPECVDGAVAEEVIIDPKNDTTKTVWSTCQVCGGADDGQHVFPGTHIGINVKADSKNDGSGVFRMIFPETDKLEYVPKKLEKLELEVRLKTVGANSIMNKEAVNEMQAKGSFASMETILLSTKNELDCLYRWIVETVGRSFYLNLNLRVEANFGTEFYLISEDDLQRRFDESKKIGLPAEEQLNIYKQLIETKYKGNSSKLGRALMLLDLDPFPMYSVEECIKLKNESVLDDFQLSLKVNFLKFISQFESENIEITQFGLGLDYWGRVERIKKELDLYNEELIQNKNIRNNPQGDDDSEGPQVTQEQLEAQARLRGSVGGVQGILGIQDSVSQGITSVESAIETMIEIYGFSRDVSIRILGTRSEDFNKLNDNNISE